MMDLMMMFVWLCGCGQVVKALLTGVTSQHCEVHEASLLLSVRSIFHIHLITKNVVNKTTAKAALTQILSVVNQRLEVFEVKSRVEADAALSALTLSGSKDSEDL